MVHAEGVEMELKENEILVLRTTDKDGKAYGGFQWPTSGMVEAPDWDGKPECGGGLHGLPKGVGHAGYLNTDGVAQVVKVDKLDGYIEFEDKCKFKRGDVIFFGELQEAANIIKAQYPGEPVVYCTLTGGYHSTLTGGEGSTLTGGHYSTLTGGDYSTLIFKYWGGHRDRIIIGYVGEDEIEPNVAYRLDDDHKIVRA